VGAFESVTILVSILHFHLLPEHVQLNVMIGADTPAMPCCLSIMNFYFIQELVAPLHIGVHR
jgi:hypothetical protein